jgi:predicted TIM-barrel enzyme
MKLNNRYHEIFGAIPIFGMIHLAGNNRIAQALEEIAIFEEEGIDGAIIENYFGSIKDVVETLKETSLRKPKIVIGLNILPNEFDKALLLAHAYKADFIQMDYVAGRYKSEHNSKELDFEKYSSLKEKYADIIVLGGVWPKYYHPVAGSDLEADLEEGMKRAEAVVVTGAGTGIQTPIHKIKRFKDILGQHPLVVGAGLDASNAYEQLCLADGAIVGTSLKFDNNTFNMIDRQRVRDFMSVVKEARKYKENNDK